MANRESLIVREWDPDEFHRRVLELEAKGYTARLESYRISPEVEPDTGRVVHLYSIEVSRVSEQEPSGHSGIE